MALFDKVKDITQFDWQKKIGDSGKTNQDNLPSEPGLPNENQETKLEGYDYGNDSLKKIGPNRNRQDNLPSNQTANKKLEDRLDEVDAIYKQNNGNKALRGENNLGFDAPFIVKDIGDSYDSANLDDGIARGGVALQLVRAAEDVVRLGKFTLTPRGILWNLKQLLLQKQNPIKESRDFNPLSTIASSAPMVHQSRNADGFNLFAEPPKYSDENNLNNIRTSQKKNRLLRLAKNKKKITLVLM